MSEKKIYVNNSTYANIRIETKLGRTQLVKGTPCPEPLFVDVDTITIKVEENDKDRAVEIIKEKIKKAIIAINS